LIFSVIQLPGSLDDRDLRFAMIPGGFSYGDYLRCGAMARFSPIMADVRRFAEAGGPVLGICNGFQILCEAGLLPGALVRNHHLHFVCEFVNVRVEHSRAPFTSRAVAGRALRLPIKHGEGAYHAPPELLADLERAGQVVLRYVDGAGEPTAAANPNGSLANIAGVRNARGNVMGLMPHPEHAVEPGVGGEDGCALLGSLVDYCRSSR
jgi:phosphoribosylformylglycinamidine synthase